MRCARDPLRMGVRVCAVGEQGAHRDSCRSFVLFLRLAVGRQPSGLYGNKVSKLGVLSSSPVHRALVLAIGDQHISGIVRLFEVV